MLNRNFTKTERTSQLLQQLLDELPQQGSVNIGEIIRHLRRRSFGGLLLILAIVGLLPGISVFAGLAMLYPGFQMAIGYKAPVLPRFIRDRVVDVDTIRAIITRSIPWLKKIERFIKPRWVALTVPPFTMITGVLTIGLAMVVMLPLPFSNLPPALALILFSLGLVERDGVLTVAGFVLAVIALAIGAFVLRLALEALTLIT